MACPFIQEPVDEEAALIRRELHLRRERIVRPRLDVLSYPEDFLFERYRFSLESITYIHTLLHPYITNLTRRGRALTSEQILCMALRFFANAVRKVCLALKHFLQVFVKFPGFPNVIGCIDGTHIPIIAPSQNEADYVNRKSIQSINVQIICDAAHIITNVEAKWPGSVHDSRIYRESSLSNRMGQGEIDGLLLGDRGYPCQPTLITPYPETEPGPQQHFNMTIGLLKSRFQCLRHLSVTPERACDIIVACVLHNIAIIRGEQHPALQIQDPEEDLIHPGDFQDGKVVRDLICRNVFGH
ncbi:putative nuclease HARBI1 [Triplophysa rosa]|uniref:Nuclease HARBI1 n=1 Tax=Triplophysa rosa TaxID=992332 RepID=A0A9W7WHD6_TRIRA|nr:putative nuclease HARBI1 [Triplophysa rosa]